MIETYAIATPIEPRRTWTIPMFKDGIERLEPQPISVGIVTSKEVFEEWFSDDDKYKLVAEHPSYDSGMGKLEMIAWNREQLRDWFWEERFEEFLFWIDSDVEVYRDTFTDIRKVMKHENCLMFSNGIQGRGGTRHWHSIACTVVHRDVANLGSFDMREILDDDGNKTRMCEDITYFASYTGTIANSILSHRKPSYDKMRVDGNATVVDHHISDRWNDKDFVYKLDDRYFKITGGLKSQ